MDKITGLGKKYTVTKRRGPTDPNADYFVLRIDSDPRARIAAAFYAALVRPHNGVFAFQLETVCAGYMLDSLNSMPAPRVANIRDSIEAADTAHLVKLLEGAARAAEQTLGSTEVSAICRGMSELLQFVQNTTMPATNGEEP